MIRELFLPLILVAVLASMLLPVPPGALDFLLVGNLILALTLFISSLYISDSLKLSSLPSLLLMATLYRLGLNVATTRAILGTGQAGDVVEGFGQVVIGGNLVVGAVIFLVITLIQFIVIAKGAERVAEVAARFTLDAMPGKQMSIDADVRAGLIDFETAGKRRNEMQTESRFYGALDGAMKFVKGDAIAGLVMVAVNIIGGLATGVVLEGLDVSRAVHKYTLLTIGDGLLSQIPALLNALAAGMVVTRVSRGDGASLAQEVLGQLWQLRKAKAIIGALVLSLAMVPGIPALPFVTLGLIFVGGALFTTSTEKPKTAPVGMKFEPRAPAVLQIELGAELARELRGSPDIGQKIQGFRRSIHHESGLILGVPELATNNDLKRQFRIQLRGVTIEEGEIRESGPQFLVKILERLGQVVRARAEELIDDILTRRTLDAFDKEAPELVSAVVPNVVSVTQLTEVLKGLVRENLSIRNFDIILQAVAESGPKAKNDRMLLEDVRAALRRVISGAHAKSGILDVIVIDPLIDIAFARAEREGRPLDLKLANLIETGLQESKTPMPLVVSKAARRLVSETLRLRGIKHPVLAHDEIIDEVELRVAQRIEVNGEASETILERLVA